MPRPLVATAHLDVRSVEQPLAGRLQLLGIVDADGEGCLPMAEHEDGTKAHQHGSGKGVANLRLESSERCVGRSVTQREVWRQ